MEKHIKAQIDLLDNKYDFYDVEIEECEIDILKEFDNFVIEMILDDMLD